MAAKRTLGAGLLVAGTGAVALGIVAVSDSDANQAPIEQTFAAPTGAERVWVDVLSQRDDVAQISINGEVKDLRKTSLATSIGDIARLIQKSHPQPKTPTPAPPQTPAHTIPTAA